MHVPSPADMPRRRPGSPAASIPQPASFRQPVRRYADLSRLPRRGRADQTAWFDTGTLYALARRPAILKHVIDHYHDRLAVASAVEREIRDRARTPAASRAPGNDVLIGMSADYLVKLLDNRTLPIFELSPTTLGHVDGVLTQLRAIEEARGGLSGPTPDRAKRHAGEASSIVNALRMQQLGGKAVLVTSDGGASLVAESRGLASKHVGHIMAELSCAGLITDPQELLGLYESITSGIAQPPEGCRPTDPTFFSCLSVSGVCVPCDDYG